MRIFGRNKESLRIKKVRAARCLYMDGPGTQEIEIRLMTEDGEILDLQLPFQVAPKLIGELTDAYESIVPPLSRRQNWQAGWSGADNDNG